MYNNHLKIFFKSVFCQLKVRAVKICITETINLINYCVFFFLANESAF